jgi:hypothetical protein
MNDPARVEIRRLESMQGKDKTPSSRNPKSQRVYSESLFRTPVLLAR